MMSDQNPHSWSQAMFLKAYPRIRFLCRLSSTFPDLPQTWYAFPATFLQIFPESCLLVQLVGFMG